MDLKGPTMRIGRFEEPYEITLKSGDEFRITTNRKVLGDQNIVSCDYEDIKEHLLPGDKILLDYGRVSFTVIRVEPEQETLKILKKKFPEMYAEGLKKNKRSILKMDPRVVKILDDISASDSDSDLEVSPRSKTPRADTPKGKSPRRSLNKEKESMSFPGVEQKKPQRKFDELFKQSKRMKSKKPVIVLQADNNCTLRSENSFFVHRVIQKKMNDLSEGNSRYDGNPWYKENQSDYGEEISCITPKDLKDLRAATKLDVDAVVLSDVRRASDIKECQRIVLAKKTTFRIIAKIQNKEAVDNFAEILKSCDGIMISRSYLAVYLPPEKFFYTQKQLITSCHRAGKPVMIVGQMLESMVSSVIPTTSEINDVSSLVLSKCDSLALVKEVIWGKYPIESLKTLNKICLEVEQLMQSPSLGSKYDPQNPDSPLKLNPSTKISIADAIIRCVINAVHQTKAPLVISFTQTGATALKLSKLPCPCPIIAVTAEEKVARICSLLASVIAYKVGSMMGTEGLIPRVMKYAKDSKLVQSNDLVVICFGEVDGVPGVTNSLKILKVE